MRNKRNIIIAALLTILCTGISTANANSLTQMDIKKSTAADTIDVTFYTTDINSNTVVTRKGNNRYVVLMPSVSSNPSVTPNIGGLKDLITDVNVKHVDDGIGGYTKVTFETTKPVNIKTHNVKSAPLTQAQKDAKTIIAQNKTTPAVKPETTQPKQTTETQTPKAAPVSTSKPATTAPKATVTDVPKTTVTKPTETKPVKQAAKTTQKTEQPKTVPQPTQTKTEQPKVKVAKNDFIDSNYDPKMKFDNDGKRKMSLEPRIAHPINTTSTKPAETKINDDNVINIDNTVVTEVMPEEVPAEETPVNESKNSLPLIILLVLGSALGIGGAYLLFDAIANKLHKKSARKNSFFNMSAKNQAKRQRREYYDIANNKELSWQEKYKLYTEKEQEHAPKEPEDASFVTNLGADKKAVIMPEEKTSVKLTQVLRRSEKSHNDIIREKLQAKISQMEHSLTQTPATNEPTEIPKGVQSEDNTIINTMKDVKLKSFSKSMSLSETTRAFSKGASDNRHFPEAPFVKLKDSKLSVNRRESASSRINLRNMIDTEKYLTNNGEIKMNKENENYLTSSLNEYLSVLDAEASKPKTVTETLSKIRPETNSTSRSGVSNPISRAKDSSLPAFHGGLIVKSGYNIDAEKGIYLVNVDGVSALVGRVKDSVTILKKFSQVVDKPLQVRAESDHVYIARVGNYKCLVDVTKDKMGTLIEI